MRHTTISHIPLEVMAEPRVVPSKQRQLFRAQQLQAQFTAYGGFMVRCKRKKRDSEPWSCSL